MRKRLLVAELPHLLIELFVAVVLFLLLAASFILVLQLRIIG